MSDLLGKVAFEAFYDGTTRWSFEDLDPDLQKGWVDAGQAVEEFLCEALEELIKFHNPLQPRPPLPHLDDDGNSFPSRPKL